MLIPSHVWNALTDVAIVSSSERPYMNGSFRYSTPILTVWWNQRNGPKAARWMEHGDVMDCRCVEEANGIVCSNRLCPWSEPNEWFWSKLSEMPRSGQQSCQSCVHLDRHRDCGNAFSRMFRRPTGDETWCICWKEKTNA